jgi:hypothetical protein
MDADFTHLSEPVCDECGEDFSKGAHWHPHGEYDPGFDREEAHKAEVKRLGDLWFKILTEREDDVEA